MPPPLRGRSMQGDEPRWDPLLALLGPRLVRWFMWMYEVVLSDGRRVQAYKHVATRRYLHLADDGSAFSCTRRETYAPLELEYAVDDAFYRWEDLLPAPDVDEPAELARVLARIAAGESFGRVAGTASSSPNGRGDHERAQTE